MYHSITYGDKNTWEDWHLVPSSRPLFNPPKVKTTYVDIPGGNGSIDLTESLNGYPVFENRQGSTEYIVMHDYWSSWSDAYSTIMGYIHGRKMRAILEDDPTHYYEGRFSVNSWKSDPKYSTITIDYNVHPYKFDLYSTTEEWKWDTFNFETGLIKYYKDLSITDDNRTLTFIGTRMTVVPTWTIQTEDGLGFYVYCNDTKYRSFPDGTYRIYDLKLFEGNNTFVFKKPTNGTGIGTVVCDYRGGML